MSEPQILSQQASPLELAAFFRSSAASYAKTHPGCTARTVLQAARILETQLETFRRRSGRPGRGVAAGHLLLPGGPR